MFSIEIAPSPNPSLSLSNFIEYLSETSSAFSSVIAPPLYAKATNADINIRFIPSGSVGRS
uniref:Uncharacterized protein n=1 Tax=uncultured marine virus TaxID=186617 RepID=A0A0F7L0Q1_9VIRU|nr:hypothetical protein [uncultured marine virus]